MMVRIRFVAFLRAINVGGHVVKMEHLRDLFEGIGFAEVKTFIASGNVIFDAPSARGLEKRIESGLRDALGYEVSTFIRTPAELTRIAAYEAASEEKLYICFLKKPPAEDVHRRLTSFNSAHERLDVSGREIYWAMRTSSFLESHLSGPALEKALGAPATVRNVNTVRRIAAIC